MCPKRHFRREDGSRYPTREYTAWMNMRQRCNSSYGISYRNYGARGILVCAEWNNDFDKFVEDMGKSPGDGYSLDRIDNNKGYSKENCRWLDKISQNNNRRDNIFIEYNGKNQTVSQWAAELGVSFSLLYKRLGRGWNIEKIMTKPKLKRNKNTFIEYNGETLTLQQWSDRLGIGSGCLHNRIFVYNWPLKDAFTYQPGERKRKYEEN